MKKTANKPAPVGVPTKIEALEAFRDYPEGAVLTTDHGVPIPHTDDSLRAGLRGPSLLEDFHLRDARRRRCRERFFGGGDVLDAAVEYIRRGEESKSRVLVKAG